MGLPIAADMCSSQLELIYGSPIAADISLKLGTVWVKILIFLFFFLRATQLVHTRYYWISQIFVFGAVVYTPFWSKRTPLDRSNYRITSPKRGHFDHSIFIILGGGGERPYGRDYAFSFFFLPTFNAVHTPDSCLSQIFVFGAIVCTPSWSKRPSLDPSNGGITSPRWGPFGPLFGSHMGRFFIKWVICWTARKFLNGFRTRSIRDIIAFLKYSTLGVSFPPLTSPNGTVYTTQNAEIQPIKRTQKKHKKPICIPSAGFPSPPPSGLSKTRKPQSPYRI